MNRVSVIIPAYRDAATLGSALDSVRAQTRRVDEILVVNDCSPESEDIEAVVCGYPEIVYIRNPRNVGLAASRNIGVRAASGEIVAFLDADDELHPQKIEFQLRVFRPDFAVACRVAPLPSSGGHATAGHFGGDFRVIPVMNSRAMMYRNRLTGASILISRELLLSCGGYDESLRSCEDYDLWLRLLDTGVTVLDIQLPLYLYRLNAQGLSRNLVSISYWELQVMRKHLRRADEAFLAQPRDALTWAFWLLKHMFRYEICLSEALRTENRRNIALLSEHPLLAGLLTLVERGRLLRPAGIFVAMSNGMTRHEAP